jgi:hypothetical protein
MAQQQELTEPRRRVRTSKTSAKRRQKVTGASEKLKLDTLTREMRAAQRAIEAAQRTLDLKAKEAFETMRAARLDSHSCPEGDLKIKVPSGRSSTTIKPKEFHELVEDDEFYDCATVSVTKARKVLSGKEIAECSTTKPAVPGAPRLEYEFFSPEGLEEDE